MNRLYSILTAMLMAAHAVVYAQTERSDSLTVRALRENGVVFTDDNHVTLLTTGAEKFEDMFSAIEQARQYVYLEYFNFRNDSIGNALFDLLERKSKEGVKIRVIYDDFGNFSNDRPLRKRHLQVLRRDGIDVVVFDPIVFPWINHALHRDHRKIVVVDGKAVSTLITVAANNDGREYVVLDGLKAGDEIVSEGAGLVREGTQVK